MAPPQIREDNGTIDERTRLLHLKGAQSCPELITRHTRKPLPFLAKVAYAMGATGPSMFDRVRSLFTTPFLLEEAQISAYSVGAILLVTKFWDAINDPLIGYLSDNTDSKWGRRRSWLLLGAIPLALSFVALWWVPPLDSDTWLIVYYLVTLLIFETTSSVAKIPHNCMISELACDYDDVTSLSQYRYFAAVAAGMAASMMQSIFLDMFDDDRLSYFASGVLWSIFCVITLWVCVWGTSPKFVSWASSSSATSSTLCSIESGDSDDGANSNNRSRIGKDSPDQSPQVPSAKATAATNGPVAVKPASKPLPRALRNSPRKPKPTSISAALLDFFKGTKDIFQYRAYWIITCVYVSTLALEFVQSNQVLYIKYVLEDTTDVLTWVILIQTIARLIAIPAWTWISRKSGKKPALIVGLFLMAAVQSVYYLLGPGDIMWFYILTPLRGAAGVCPVLLLFSMVADCVDLDDLQTGQRREGLFYSFFVFFQKVSISGALALSNFVIGAAGYEAPERGDTGDVQPDSVVFALRIMSSLAPAAIFLVAFAVAFFYPITRQVHSEIQEKLDQRNREILAAAIEDGLVSPPSDPATRV